MAAGSFHQFSDLPSELQTTSMLELPPYRLLQQCNLTKLNRTTCKSAFFWNRYIADLTPRGLNKLLKIVAQKSQHLLPLVYDLVTKFIVPTRTTLGVLIFFS